MESRISLIGLIATSVLWIAPAMAQTSLGPSSKPNTLAAMPGFESRDSVRAMLAKGGTISYSLVNLDDSSKSVVTVSHLVDDEYVRSDGTKLKDLTDLVHDVEFSYSPPVPLVRGPLVPGQKWQHTGTINLRGGLQSSHINSHFLVLGKASIATPAGQFEAVEVVETREFHGNNFIVHRYVDERLNIVLKEVWKTIGPQRSGGGTAPLTGRRVNTDMTLDRFTSPGPSSALAVTPDSESSDSVRGLLVRGGTIGYVLVNRDVNSKSVVTLRHLRDDEYVRSDGTKLKDLTDLVHDAQYSYAPPIPLMRGPLVPGKKWEHTGTINERGGIAISRIESSFVVSGKTSVATPAGQFEAVEIVETRQFAGHAFTVHRYVDEKRGIVLKEVWKTIRINVRAFGGGGSADVDSGRVNTELTLNRFPSR